MNLTVSGEITARVLTLLKRDTKLARHLAEQFLASVDRQAMACYLLSGELALDLLTRRLRTNPEQTVRELGRLAGAPRGGGRGGARAAESGRRGKRVKRRKRLSPAQAERLRADVRSFLAKKPWSSRKQLTAAVAFPSQAIYNRIMGELKSSGEVVQKGQKSKTTYAVKAKR
jgi:hypothetical protein